MTFENWLGIVGGIAMFLFGIKIMGNGIERLAGAKLKKILEKLTTNRFLGLFFGMLITGIIQSSNAVSVMTVGFVNAGLMPLERRAVRIDRSRLALHGHDADEGAYDASEGRAVVCTSHHQP